MLRKLILVVIDGLTPEVFEQAVERRTAPTLADLHAAGSYARATSTFPSLTPVCMATLATGAHPDVHEIPHLVWYHRGEGRLVEYGSSFGAMRAAGTRRAIRDAIVEMNAHHLSRNATTVFESLEDAGLTAAAVNTPFYDGFDFLFYYLPDYDYASHALGPGGAEEALRRSDQAVGALVDAAGGLDEFLQRYAVVVCSDHGQTHVDRVVRLQDWVGDEGLVTASNRAGMVYTDEPRRIAERLAREDAVDIALFMEDGAAVALRDGGELKLGADSDGWQIRGRRALASPNAGDVLLSAAGGVEFADLGGRHHAGGGSHGSLLEGDSLVPMLTVGTEEPPGEIAGVAPLVLGHFGIEAPAYARAA